MKASTLLPHMRKHCFNAPSSLTELGVNPHILEGTYTMYAVAFDLDTELLGQTYGKPNPNNAYAEIRNFMTSNGFNWQQGSLYYGDPERINAVTCMTVIQQLSRQYAWFSLSVRDIRMLRIEENNDLRPAIDIAVGNH
jgi:virulence-associated protein VapD